ncbi:MAG TPA: cold shock and DUF1294 domain-containing protein [Rhodocyclaceae bacterium]|nr:cold shock and DUF1294 domain-containing protein [Rhodocyclaceae bacterium]HRQ48739.1 cold shock and DUF1294 domain-containing protein [Rhodocyclaceae bacterium]
MRYQGRITDWKDDKGFGFITPNGGGDAVFVHIKAFANRNRRPEGDELVTYALETDDRGRPRAGDVAFVGEKRPTTPKRTGRSNVPVVLASVFVAALAAATVSGKLPFLVPGVYMAASIIAFAAYALDKSAAQSGKRRTREGTLHAFALVGGWPGALAAQRRLRHKSSKQSFQVTFWITVAMNCGALGWLMTSDSAATLRSLLDWI